MRDWKFSAPIEQALPSGMKVHARLCGWTLARAHARSGDRIAPAAYLGGSHSLNQAIADFAETYADQNERDYATLRAAARDGWPRVRGRARVCGHGNGLAAVITGSRWPAGLRP